MMHQIATLVFTLMTFFNSSSQVNNNFQGSWHINPAASENGGSAPVELVLTETADSLFIARTTSDNKSFTEKLSFNGGTCVCITTSGRRKSGSAKWDSDARDAFTENAVIGDAKNPDETAFTVTEHWKLSGDSKQLTEEIHITAASGASFVQKLVYDRE